MPIRVVVTGTSGQVVSALRERASTRDDIELVTIGRPDIDFREPEMIAEAVKRLDPQVVVNAAAYTAVDKAEEEPEVAQVVNGQAAAEVARGAALAGAPIIQISTDYVFDGEQRRAYREDDAVNPVGIYGASKLEGERLASAANPEHFIFRTAWVYSPFGNNFVKTMLRLSETRDALSVVDDQLGNPTSAFDIADGVLAAIGRIGGPSAKIEPGVYHLSGTGTASWCELAREIFSVAGKPVSVKAITTAEYPTPAARPANSRLDCTRFEAAFGYRAPDWRLSLRECLARLQG